MAATRIVLVLALLALAAACGDPRDQGAAPPAERAVVATDEAAARPSEPELPAPVQPRVTLGELKVTGALDAAAVGAVLDRARGRLGFCYRRRLAVAPALEGTLTIAWRVSELGEVEALEVAGLDHGDLHACVASAIRSLRFPAPATGEATIETSAQLQPPG